MNNFVCLSIASQQVDFVYNQEDEIEELVLKSQSRFGIPYKTHPFTISYGHTTLESDEGPIPLQIFGNHNTGNLLAHFSFVVKWVLSQMFYEAIPSFTGAAKRLELFSDRPGKRIYQGLCTCV